jgi:hypothetical protein
MAAAAALVAGATLCGQSPAAPAAGQQAAPA